MKYIPHSNSALWTTDDVEVMRFRARVHYPGADYQRIKRLAIMLNGPISDDERDSRDFHEYQTIGHCRCLQCSST